MQQLEEPPPPEPPPVQTRSGRQVRPPRHLIAEAYETLAMGAEVIDMEQEENPIHDVMAFATSSNPDIMYVDQALQAPDRQQFLAAMEKEVVSHHNNKHWEVIRRSDVPKGAKILPAVW